ncbi:MAG TPA: glycine cleavage T C-terminal barrel domain-containing protein [Vicinamibacteria bacterium]|nr:glycine cleavage T C-terminal barrel domain-containing protein [Vicinamibacteria bacterium]
MNPARRAAAHLELARGVLSVSGPKRQDFLNGLLSNEVASLRPGEGRLAALMDARGHVLALMRALVTNDSVLLEAPTERLETLRALLERYRVAAPVRFAVPKIKVVAVLGPAASATLVRAGAGLAALGPNAHVEATLAGLPVRVASAPDLPAEAQVVHVAASAAAAVHDALVAAGSTPLTPEAFDALRIEEGRPLFGVDVTEDNLLHETGLLAEYHSSTKGCYVGQETVARLEARGGHVNKALRGLRLSRAAAPGATIQVDGQEIGRLTSAGVSDRLGPIAMGYVHRNHFAPGTAVVVDGAPASVTALPFPE